MTKTVDQIIDEAEEFAANKEDRRVISMLKDIAMAARAEERAKIIFRGEELAGMYLDGPLRDSVYALFEELKTI